jgi:LCP family protein required for cell wall assembly
LPGADRRVTVLLVGVDNTHAAERGLTDTLIVASFDPISHSLTMISIPRDTARLPMYMGGEFSGRVNNLMRTAARNPELYPDGAMGTLVNELSYIVGVPIDYYAQIDIAGFTALVDMVGGVDVVLDTPIQDATYQFSPTETGFYLDAGPHHLDGKLATAYARSRHGPGNSDYERARRQQQILLALRTKFNDPRLMANLPGLLYVLSNIVRTDAPLDRLPDIVSIALSRSSSARTAGTPSRASRYRLRGFGAQD